MTILNKLLVRLLVLLIFMGDGYFGICLMSDVLLPTNVYEE